MYSVDGECVCCSARWASSSLPDLAPAVATKRRRRKGMSHAACRLCRESEGTRLFFADRKREYLFCEHCRAIFVPDRFVVPPHVERAEYETHDNFTEDEGYRRFLARAIQPLLEHVPHFAEPRAEHSSPCRGLDFGCGPNPLLAKMLSARPYSCNMDFYDKYFFPDTVDLASLTNTYDFITATEVFEHLHSPLAETERLWRALKPGGVLVVMTKRSTGTVESFRSWHYIRDCTHILFFTEEAFAWLARFLSEKTAFFCDVSFWGKDIALLQKKNK